MLSTTQQKESNATQSNEPTIRFRTHMNNTIYDVMRDRGWKEADPYGKCQRSFHSSSQSVECGNELDWDFFWADVTWVHEVLDHVHLQEHQKVNHFRNHYELTRKDLLLKNMKRMVRSLDKEYGRAVAQKFEFMPTGFVLPQEHGMFHEEFKKWPTGTVWIMKPIAKAQGKGIFLVNKMSQVNAWRQATGAGVAGSSTGSTVQVSGNVNPTTSKESLSTTQSTEEAPEAYIIQRYIHNPYLISSKKFDMRIYVLVVSYNPLIVYVHRNGFCRFSNFQFSMEAKDISNLYIHATNVAVQKTSPNYDGDKGCKWLLRNLRQYLSTKHGIERINQMFADMEALIVRTLLSVQKVMIHDKHCFELYGYDILLDENLKPWLLEVNASPSFTAETQMDYELKHAVLNDCFDCVDIERKQPANAPRRARVGGFDLVYNDGPVRHEHHAISTLGSYQPFPSRPLIANRIRPQPAFVSYQHRQYLLAQQAALASTEKQ